MCLKKRSVEDRLDVLKEALSYEIGNLRKNYDFTTHPNNRSFRSYECYQMKDILFVFHYDSVSHLYIYLIDGSNYIEVFGDTSDPMKPSQWKYKGSWVKYIDKYFNSLEKNIKLIKKNKLQREKIKKKRENLQKKKKDTLPGNLVDMDKKYKRF